MTFVRYSNSSHAARQGTSHFVTNAQLIENSKDSAQPSSFSPFHPRNCTRSRLGPTCAGTNQMRSAAAAARDDRIHNKLQINKGDVTSFYRSRAYFVMGKSRPDLRHRTDLLSGTIVSVEHSAPIFRREDVPS